MMKKIITYDGLLDINFSDSCINIAYPTNGVSFSFHIVSSLEATAWKDWQTVLHEFGHYVQSVSGLYDNNLMEIIRYKPNHSYDDDALEAHGDSLYSLKLAWMESWATIFSFVCYDYYAQYYPIPDFAIECFDIINEFEDLYFGNRKRDKYSCEAQETSIIGYLWDLYDSDNEAEENDYQAIEETAYSD